MIPFDRDRDTRPGTVFVVGRADSALGRRVADAAGQVGLQLLEGRSPRTPRAWELVQAAEIVVVVHDGHPDGLVMAGAAAVLGKKLLVVAVPDAEPLAELAPVPLVQATGPRVIDRIARELDRLRELPILERTTMAMPAADRLDEVVDAEVVQVQPGIALVRTLDGREALLMAEDLSWTRKVHDLRRVLQLGQVLHGALVGGDDERARFSVRALEDDPWPALENLVDSDDRIEGTVFSWQPRIGLFVDIGRGVNGLVPRSTLPDDARFEGGEPVTVAVRKVDREAKEVELRLVGAPAPPRLPPLAYDEGDHVLGTVTHVQPGRGYALVALPDGFSAILPLKRLSTAVRDALLTGALRPGDSLPVTVAAVDRRRRRIELADDTRSRQPPPPPSPRRRAGFPDVPATQEFGQRVRRIRQAAGFTQEELAVRAELHRTYIGSLERGDRNLSLHHLLRVAAALGVEPGDLVRGLKP